MTTADLRAEGISHSAISKRVRRGALFRRYHGVYSLSPGELTQEGEWTAALLAAGEDAALSDLSAAIHCGAWRYPEDLIHITLPRRHVPIPRRAAPSTAPGAARRLHRRWPAGHERRADVRGLTDTLMPEELTNVIHEAAFRKCFDVEATRRIIERERGRKHLWVLEQALEDWLDGSAGLKSRNERAFLVLITNAGLPRPRTNVHVLGNEVDFHWPEHRLVVEVDGDQHSRPPTRLDDRRRDREMNAEGWTTLRLGPPRSNIGGSGYWQPSDASWPLAPPMLRVVDAQHNRFVSAYSVVPL